MRASRLPVGMAPPPPTPLAKSLNQAAENLSNKVTTKKRTITKKRASEVAPATAEAEAAPGEPEMKQRKKQQPKKRVTKPSVDRGPVLSMEEHMRRDDELALFSSKADSAKRNVNDVLLQIPESIKNPTEIIASCARIKSDLPWFVSMQNFVAGSDDVYEFPDTPVLSHEIILRFLREPAPLSTERPCCNLDREPNAPFENGLVRCIAHRMSEKELGPAHAFRLREMIFSDARQEFPDICYLCHLWMGMCEAFRQRDKTAERARPDLKDPPDDNVVLINRFMVMVDQIGEYDRNKMLVSDKVGLGIWGPFPLFNEKDYMAVARKPGMPAHFVESSNLLFRLSPASSLPIESSSQSTQKRSGLTAEPPLSGTGLP